MNFRHFCKNSYFFCLLAYALFDFAAVQAQSDVTPPEVVAFNFVPTVIVDSPSAQPVTFTLRITDDVSGFQSGSWRLVSFSGQQFYDIAITGTSRISGNGQDGIYESVFALPPHSETGQWHVADLNVTDVAGNARTYDDLPVYGSPAVFNAAPLVSRVYARDFNLDNVPDIAVLSGTPQQTPTVYLGSGDGTFGPGLTNGSSGPNGWPLIGDFNGDGAPDIAIREISDVVSGTSPVGVLFGNGNGTFQPYRGVGSLPYDTVASVGDFDGDGKSDLVGSGSWGGIFDPQFSGIIILYGRSDGNFDRSVLDAGAHVGTMLAGDFNSDGEPDIVWAWPQGKFVVLLGQGSRTFGSPIEHSSAGEPDRFAAADFNDDGKLDLAVRYGAFIGVLLGNGDGTFQPVTPLCPTEPGSAIDASDLKVSDIDGDGRPDLAIDAQLGVVLLINNGDGSFRWNVLTTGGGNAHANTWPLGFGIADFNGDGRADFLAAWFDDQVGVYLGAPTASTTLSLSSPTSAPGQTVSLSATVTPAGLSGPVTFYDGVNVIGSASLVAGQAVFTTTMLGPGPHVLRAAFSGAIMGATASFSPEVGHTVNALPASGLLAGPEVQTGFQPVSLATGDFNHDGIPDLVSGTAGTSEFESWIGTGGGSFQRKGRWGGGIGSFPRFAVGDMTQDGILDVVPVEGTFRGIGDGTFQYLPNSSQVGSASFVSIGDFNRDGKLDRAEFWEGQFLLKLGSGDGSRSPFPCFTADLADHRTEAVLGDFDADGNLDVAAVTTEVEDLLIILLGNGDGTFQTPIVSATGTPMSSLVTADFNGDAKLDLAFVRAGSGTVRILLGQGDGHLLPGVDLSVGGTLARILAADLNGDGHPDLSVLSGTEQRVLVFPGNGNGTFGTARKYFVGTGPVDLVATDFNGDGRMDLAVASTAFKFIVLLGVNPSPTSILLDVVPSSSTLSQEVTMTATVTPSNATGWVTFNDGATPLGSVPVSAGQAAFKIRFLGSGSHLLQAVFSGDGTNYRSCVSPLKTVKVSASSVFAFGPEVKLSPGTASLAGQADFDADGKVDLAVYGGSQVTILLGQGNGQFSAGTPFAAAGGNLLAADFNRDGKIDLIAGGSLYLGKGNGTFESPQYVAGGGSAVFAADFNGDGATDLVDFSNNISIFLNRGNGTFEPAIETTHGITAFWPIQGAVGDLNGDGKADLTILDRSNGYVFVFWGKGDGTFQSPVQYPTVASPDRIVISDLNADGVPDLAVGSLTAGRIGIMLGIGPGTFENWGDALTGLDGLDYLGVCDCDGDDKTDLLASSSPTVKFLRGLGNGTFQAGTDYASFADAVMLSITDLNQDGRPDLLSYGMMEGVAGILTNMAVYPSSASLTLTPSPAKLSEEVTLTAAITPVDAAGTVTFTDGATILGKAAIASGQALLKTKWLGAGGHKVKAIYSGDPLRYINSMSGAIGLTIAARRSGGLGAGTAVATGRGPRGLAAADLNGDGKQDLVIANATSNTVSVLLGNGVGGFAARVSYNTGSAPVGVVVTDLNGDGKLDVAAANSGAGNVSILYGNGDGTLQAAVNRNVVGSPRSLFAADLNGDLSMELLAGTNGGGSSGKSTVYIVQFLDVNMSGYFFYNIWNLGAVTGVAAADLNGDGKIDVPLAAETGRFTALLQQSGWTFTDPYPMTVGTAPAGLAMGDFNGDGKPDMATANTGSNDASVLIGKGDGTFQTAVSYAAGSGPAAIATTDCDGDGNLDLVIVNGTGNSLSILRGKGDGTFLAGSTVTTGGSPGGVVAADFDGNGITDLAVTNSADDTVSIFLGRPLEVRIDFNGDALWDAFLYNSTTGAWSEHFGSGTGFANTANGWWSPAWQITPADFNGDAITDLFLYNPDYGYWYKAIGNGSGSFTYYSGQWSAGWDVHATDLNGDGRSDIFLFHSMLGIWYRCISPADPADGFIYSSGYWSPGWTIYPVDWNGDGKTDLFLYNKANGSWYQVTNIDPDPSVWSYSAGSWMPGWEIQPGDFNGDGKTDVFLYMPASGAWYFAMNTGSGFSYTAGYWAPGWKIHTGDFDGDGASDIFVYSTTTGQWYQCISDKAGYFSAYHTGNWSTVWQVQVADYNNDGKADVLLHYPDWGVWYLCVTQPAAGTFAYYSGTWEPGVTLVIKTIG